MDKISTIRIEIGQEVKFTDEINLAIQLLESIICIQYQKNNPDRIMWPGHTIPPSKENGYSGVSSMSEREDYYGVNPNNPNMVELRKKHLDEVIGAITKSKQNELPNN